MGLPLTATSTRASRHMSGANVAFEGSASPPGSCRSRSCPELGTLLVDCPLDCNPAELATTSGQPAFTGEMRRSLLAEAHKCPGQTQQLRICVSAALDGLGALETVFVLVSTRVSFEWIFRFGMFDIG
jgi:hypothetical protein